MGLPEVRHLIVLPESMRRGAIERTHHTVAHKAVKATVAELHKTDSVLLGHVPLGQ
jgi:hypothetical protein